MASWTRRGLLTGAGVLVVAGGAAVADRYAAARAHEVAAVAVWTPPIGAPADEEALLLRLVHAATLAANGHNTQPWIFRLSADEIRIEPDFARRTPVVDPDDHHLFASLGCAAENLALAAARWGRSADIAAATDGVRVRLGPPGSARPARLSYEAIHRRRCVRLDYDGRPLPTEEWSEILAAGSLPGVEVSVHTAAAEKVRLAELVVAGNTAQMADPAFVDELESWIRFDGRHAAATRDGLYAASSGNPTAPAWLGRRLFRLAFTPDAENRKYERHVATSAGLVAIVADRDDPIGWIAAGRSAQRMALAAAARDVRTAFLNQPIEVLSVRPALRAFLGTERRPNLLLRFGRGPEVPRALRRPPEAVIVAA